MSKHTPGPWGNRKVFKLTAVTEAPTDPKAHEANARLMAAAPDMLKALMQFISEMDEGREWISDDTIDQAVRAITKATGE